MCTCVRTAQYISPVYTAAVHLYCMSFITNPFFLPHMYYLPDIYNISVIPTESFCGVILDLRLDYQQSRVCVYI